MSRQDVLSLIKQNYDVDNRVALNKASRAVVDAGHVNQAKALFRLAAGADHVGARIWTVSLHDCWSPATVMQAYHQGYSVSCSL